jgi:hypothetical protein
MRVTKLLSPSFSLACALFVGAVAWVTTTAPASADEAFLPPSPHIDQPLYQPNRAGVEHYVQDNLQRLIEGQTWTWGGNHYEAVRLHRIDRAGVVRAKQANRDFSAPLRGWTIVQLHVKVNGQLKAARVEVNSSYVWQPGGWRWEQVLLYLGNGDSWDFASRRVR